MVSQSSCEKNVNIYGDIPNNILFLMKSWTFWYASCVIIYRSYKLFKTGPDFGPPRISLTWCFLWQFAEETQVAPKLGYQGKTILWVLTFEWRHSVWHILPPSEAYSTRIQFLQCCPYMLWRCTTIQWTRVVLHERWYLFWPKPHLALPWKPRILHDYHTVSSKNVQSTWQRHILTFCLLTTLRFT